MAKKKSMKKPVSAAQWAFAGEYIRTGSKLKALFAAYPNWREKTPAAQRMFAEKTLKSAGVRKALVELSNEMRQAEKLTLEGHLAELREIREMAKKEGKLSVAAKCEELRGKVCGFYVDRSMQVTVSASPEELRSQFHALVEQYPQVPKLLGLQEEPLALGHHSPEEAAGSGSQDVRSLPEPSD